MKIRSCSGVLLILLVLLTAFQAFPCAYAPTASEDMLIKIFENANAAAWALERDEIDINDWPLSKDFIDRWSVNRNITLDEYAAMDNFQIDLNNQWWPTGPNDPTHSSITPRDIYYVPGAPRDTAALYFRRAIAHLTNKPKYIREYLQGQGYQKETEVPYPALAGYIDYRTLTNATATDEYPNGPGYIYQYSRERAIKALRLGGFEDFDHDTVIEWNKKYPDPWTGPGDTEELPTIKLWARIDDFTWRQVSKDLAAEMDAVGIKKAPAGPLVVILAEKSACFYAVMVTFNYNIYTGGGWNLGTDLSFQYDLYHSSMGQFPMGTNYPGFKNTYFDYWAEKVKYAPTEADIKPATINAQWVKAKYIPVIHLWTSKAVKAYRTGWEGVVNMAGYGIDQPYTFHEMNWTGIDERNVTRWGISNNPLNLNIIGSGGRWPEAPTSLVAWWPLWDSKVLSNIYDSLVNRNPYNLAEEVGFLATDWSVGIWGNPPKTVATFKVRTDAYFADGSQVKPADVAFSLLVVRDAGAGVAWNFPSAKDIDYVEINGQVVKVYFNVLSFWALHWAGFMPIMNKDLWFDAIGVPGVYIAQYDRNSQGFTGAGYSASGFIQDDIDGAYYGGSFANAPLAVNYRPWKDKRGGNPYEFDLSEDGSFMWKFVSYTPGESVNLTRHTLFYSDSSAITWKGHYDWTCPFDAQNVGIKCRPWLTPTPPCYKTTDIERFIHEAFHERGNVNYPGAYGNHTHTGWYWVDEKIDIDDLIRIATAAPSGTGHDTTLWPEANWGNGLNQYNIDADVTGDQIVDVEDLSLAGTYFMRKEG